MRKQTLAKIWEDAKGHVFVEVGGRSYPRESLATAKIMAGEINAAAESWAREKVKMDNLLIKAFKTKYRANLGEFCDRKHHASFTGYKRYRRGKNRCLECGFKIGPVRLDTPKSKIQRIANNLFSESPLLKLLRGDSEK